jgi:hypothetical protein
MGTSRPNELSEISQHGPKNSGRGSPNRCIVSSIFLAANLHDIIGLRGFGKLSGIVKELESINATHLQQPRPNRAFSRYIE